MRVFPDPPEGGIPINHRHSIPYSEVIYCYFGKYAGPDAGLILWASAFSHHNQLKSAAPDMNRAH